MSGIRLLEGVATGRAVVIVDARGENSIVVSAGANGEVRGAAVEHALADLRPSDVVVLQNEISVEATATAARTALARGAQVVWNAAPAPAGRAEILDDVDLLVVNEGELGAIAQHLRLSGTSVAACVDAVRDAVGAGVVCTRGAAGAVFSIGAESGTLPAPAVRAVDTTGAGDTFVGYLCAQWAIGGTGTVVEPIQLAINAAALAVTRQGAASAVPSPGIRGGQPRPGSGRVERRDDRMKVALGADHAGFPLKAVVRAAVERLGHEVLDCGTDSEQPVDFPDITAATCEPVLDGRADRAILVCGTGAGAIMAANKIAGIRCALAHEPYSAHQAVEHDDANAIAMGAWLVPRALVEDIVDRFLSATFDDDEDTNRRVAKLHALERRSAETLR